MSQSNDPEAPLITDAKSSDTTKVQSGHAHGYAFHRREDKIMAPQMGQKLVMEFIGTMFLSLAASNSTTTAYGVGLMLAVMVYAGGPISGGHYNPAVSLAVMLRFLGTEHEGTLEQTAPYILVQFIGAFMGSYLGNSMRNGAGLKNTYSYPDFKAGYENYFAAFGAEAFFTFALCIVVLLTATVKNVSPNSYYGLAIGGTVTASALAGGSISGGGYNPALGVVLPLVAGYVSWGKMMCFLIAPIFGAVAAAGVFRFVQRGRSY